MEPNVIKKTVREGSILFSNLTPGDGIKKAIQLGRQLSLMEIKESKMKGRGGAGFPVSTKLMLTAAAKDPVKYVVCNADEGEPGTFKDRVLLAEYPHKFLEGMIIAGFITGAKEGLIYLRGEYVYMLRHLNKIINEFREKKLLGENLFGIEDFSFDVKITLGAGAYVCGEETALIESLEGHRGEPRNRPPYPVNTGFMEHPTAVNNVETLATLPHILLIGGKAFSRYGTELSTGSKLFSISGDCKKPGVYELEWGFTVKSMLERVGAKDTKAVQIGGASGVCIPESQFERRIAYEDLPTGGSIIIFNKSRSMLHVLKNFMEFFVEESCGQCTPCRIGNMKLLEGVEKIEKGEYTFRYINTLKDLAQTMKVSSKCGLGQSSPNPFLSILENFKDEIFSLKGNGVYHE
ncbi:MAG: iron hydrogenase [Ignavibacteriaceae bacterium]|nr:iron hydrogenase [Ignavibacteriaceae bacterium]